MSPIFDVRAPPRRFTGVVEAPDETSALKAAIEEFGIVNPDQQKRLFVRRVAAQRFNSSSPGH